MAFYNVNPVLQMGGGVYVDHFGRVNMGHWHHHALHNHFFYQPSYTETQYVHKEQEHELGLSFCGFIVAIVWVAFIKLCFFGGNNPGRRQRQQQQQQQQQQRSHSRSHPSGRFHIPTRDAGAPPAKPYIIEEIENIRLDSQDLAVRPSCLICSCDFTEGETVKRLPCGHVFHEECTFDWLCERCTCPICRWEFPTDDQNYEVGRQQRMLHRVPRYYEFELERASVKQLKQLLRQGDSYRPVERADLLRHLRETRSFELIHCETTDYDDGASNPV